MLHALMDVLDAAGDDEAALEAALRDLTTGLSDDDLNGLGDLDTVRTFPNVRGRLPATRFLRYR